MVKAPRLDLAVLYMACLIYLSQCSLGAHFNAGMIQLEKGLLSSESNREHLELAERHFARATIPEGHSVRVEGFRMLAGAAQGDWRGVDRLSADDSLLEGMRGNVVRVALAKLCWQAGEKERAVDLWAQAGDMQTFKRYTVNLMKQCQDSGELEDALFWFQKAYSFFPDDVHLTTNGGADILWRLGRRSEAIAVLEQAVAANPDSAHAWHTLCRRYSSHVERMEEALAACRQAIAVDPGFVYTHGTLTGVLMHLDQPYEAEEVMLKGLSIDTAGKLDHRSRASSS